MFHNHRMDRARQLAAQLPNDDTVLRYFEQPGPGHKLEPFVIARNVSSDDFHALLDLLGEDEKCTYVRDLDLDSEGTLHIAEMSSTWHDHVAHLISTQLVESLIKAGLNSVDLQPLGGGRDVERHYRRPDCNFIPFWSKEDREKICTDFPQLKDDFRTGTLLVEVAFSESYEHVQNKVKETWKSAGIFPLLILIVDFVGCGSEHAMRGNVPIRLDVELHRKQRPYDGHKYEKLQSFTASKEAGCTSAGLEQFMVHLPVSELLFGLSKAQTILFSSFEIDFFKILQAMEFDRQLGSI